MALYETIKYQVIQRDGACEIREYDNILLASTKTRINTSMDTGFGNVFRYITGNNKAGKKISMTTPVVSYEEDDQLVTGFYVPSIYDKTSVPEPASSDVFIQELKKSRYAVIQFRGSWSEKNYEKHDEILKEYIAHQPYRICSVRLIFRYQPPLYSRDISS